MIGVGQRIATDFTLQIVRDGAKSETSFGELLRRPTIVSVYMKNNTGSCDRQNDSLVAHASEFARRGYDLIALSRDTCGSHLKYAAKKNIGYTLASDPDDMFARATGSVVEKQMYGRTFHGPSRSAYVIAPDGVVLGLVPKVDSANHAAQLHALLDDIERSAAAASR